MTPCRTAPTPSPPLRPTTPACPLGRRAPPGSRAATGRRGHPSRGGHALCIAVPAPDVQLGRQLLRLGVDAERVGHALGDVVGGDRQPDGEPVVDARDARDPERDALGALALGRDVDEPARRDRAGLHLDLAPARTASARWTRLLTVPRRTMAPPPSATSTVISSAWASGPGARP